MLRKGPPLVLLLLPHWRQVCAHAVTPQADQFCLSQRPSRLALPHKPIRRFCHGHRKIKGVLIKPLRPVQAP